MRLIRSGRIPRPLLLVVLALGLLGGRPVGAQEAPLRAPQLFAPAPPAFFAAAPGAPQLPVARSGGGSKLGAALVLIAAGVGMIYGGQEVQDAIGFPGAVIRYTGYTTVIGGVLVSCGCL